MEAFAILLAVLAVVAATLLGTIDAYKETHALMPPRANPAWVILLIVTVLLSMGALIVGFAELL